MSYALLVSDQHDPYYNLALEDWLLRHFIDQQPVILMYRNHPCVVIGRAQNPWKECDIRYCQQHNIDIVRRQSGGGTVYHDLGNVNISFICPMAHYNKAQNLDLIVNALRDLGYPATKNERHDIMLHQQGQDYKISGSAFRESKDRAFHHMTLLLQADLSGLTQALRSPLEFITSKGVDSVRSPVTNLGLTQTQVIAALQQQLLAWQDIDLDHDYLQQKQQEYRSWEWRFGKTLAFTISHQGCTISIDHGLVTYSDHPDYPVGKRF